MNIREEITKIISDELDKQPEEITKDTQLDDPLARNGDLDKLDVLEKLQSRFEIIITNDEATNIITFEDAVKCVIRKINNKPIIKTENSEPKHQYGSRM